MTIEALLEDIERFSDGSEDCSKNLANANFLEACTTPFYFSNDCNFDQSLKFLANEKPRSSQGKIRVALFVGEGQFPSISTYLEKHVDVVILIDIDDTVLKHAKFLYDVIRLNKECKGFARDYIGKNILIGSKYKVFLYKEGKRVTMDTVADKEIFSKSLLKSNKILGENHFIETDQRYEKCRDSLLKLNFAFAKVDLLDIKRMLAFKKILDMHNAVITVVNVTNLFDYDGDFELRHFKNSKKPFKPTGILFKTLETITDKNFGPIVLFSRMDASLFYSRLTCGQATSIEDYKIAMLNYVTEINQYASECQLPYRRAFGRFFNKRNAEFLIEEPEYGFMYSMVAARAHTSAHKLLTNPKDTREPDELDNVDLDMIQVLTPVKL